MMDWNKLLTQERFTGGSSRKTRTAAQPTPQQEHYATVFQDDAERIIYSTAFRRLQGKTQVYPFPNFDYLRTRLTHTVEVAHVGRVMANAIAKELHKAQKITEEQVTDIGDIVYAACLAHDLGNPPFGHVGEYAIRTWFEENLDRIKIKKDSQQGKDLLYFDGNAQGFRILTRLSGWRYDGGLRLSKAVLGTFSKYPFPSSSKRANKSSHDKKFGFMEAEQNSFNQIANDLGLEEHQHGGYCRHPLTFIVEAADDICYLTSDIDDAHRMGRIETKSAEALLHPIGEQGQTIPQYSQFTGSDKEPQDKIAYLRGGAVSALMDSVVTAFLEQQGNILEGQFDGELLDASSHKETLNKIKKTCRENVYREGRKLEIEQAGFTVIHGLMDMFGNMIINLKEKGWKVENLSMKDQGIYYLLPKEFRKQLLVGNNGYTAFLVMVDYISGCTDRFALELYQKLSATNPNLGRML